MNTTIKQLHKAINNNRFAYTKYYGGKSYRDLFLTSCPLFTSYGQIGYTVTVCDGSGQQIEFISRDDEQQRTQITISIEESTGKCVNDIIEQSRRLMCLLWDGHRQMEPEEQRRFHKIAEIGRAYLHNFAMAFKLPYGSKTWQKIGNEILPREIYAR